MNLLGKRGFDDLYKNSPLIEQEKVTNFEPEKDKEMEVEEDLINKMELPRKL